jgi:hypothetical protein
MKKLILTLVVFAFTGCGHRSDLLNTRTSLGTITDVHFIDRPYTYSDNAEISTDKYRVLVSVISDGVITNNITIGKNLYIFPHGMGTSYVDFDGSALSFQVLSVIKFKE